MQTSQPDRSSASLVNSENTCNTCTYNCVALLCNINSLCFTFGLSLLWCSPFVQLHMQEDFKNRLKILKVKTNLLYVHVCNIVHSSVSITFAKCVSSISLVITASYVYRPPLLLFCNTWKWQSGNQWGRPGNTYRMMWMQGACRGAGLTTNTCAIHVHVNLKASFLPAIVGTSGGLAQQQSA